MRKPLVCHLFLRRVLLMLLIVFFAGMLFAKRNDDVVIMQNGDRFTGKIKGLQYGELIFQAAYMKDSVHLDWSRVLTLTSKDMFIVTLTNGHRMKAALRAASKSAPGEKQFYIVSVDGGSEVAPPEVISIEHQEVTFWTQLKGSVTYGFGFASGNTSANSSLGADVEYSTDKNAITLATTSQFDAQKMREIRTASPLMGNMREHWHIAGLPRGW